MTISRFLMIALACLFVAACATRPQPLTGEFPDFYPDQTTDRSVNATVRWGGTLVEARPEADRTCLEVVASELDRNYRPVISDYARGRFIACRDKFLEPETFQPGRQVTIIGRLSQFSDGRVGEFVYRYPVLDAEVVYLWPQQFHGGYYHPYYYHPYYYPWYPYGFHPFHFHGRIIHAPRRTQRATLTGAARRSGG